jgi:hypothetical protein
MAAMRSTARAVRLVIEVLQAGVLAGLGLTPLGARFIHGVAPDGSVWKAAAAWLVIAVPLAAAQAPRHRRRAPSRPRSPTASCARCWRMSSGTCGMVT